MMSNLFGEGKSWELVLDWCRFTCRGGVVGGGLLLLSWRRRGRPARRLPWEWAMIGECVLQKNIGLYMAYRFHHLLDKQVPLGLR